jgi:hypothetical protein
MNEPRVFGELKRRMSHWTESLIPEIPNTIFRGENI